LRYGLPARGVAKTTLSIEGFGDFVTSTAAPIATGWSESCRVGLPPTEDRRLVTAHHTILHGILLCVGAAVYNILHYKSRQSAARPSRKRTSKQ